MRLLTAALFLVSSPALATPYGTMKVCEYLAQGGEPQFVDIISPGPAPAYLDSAVLMVRGERCLLFLHPAHEPPENPDNFTSEYTAQCSRMTDGIVWSDEQKPVAITFTRAETMATVEMDGVSVTLGQCS